MIVAAAAVVDEKDAKRARVRQYAKDAAEAKIKFYRDRKLSRVDARPFLLARTVSTTEAVQQTQKAYTQALDAARVAAVAHNTAAEQCKVAFASLQAHDTMEAGAIRGLAEAESVLADTSED